MKPRKPAVSAPRSQAESHVRERTRELTLLNEELKTEIAERIQTEGVLRAEMKLRKASEEKLHAMNLALAESEERFRSLVGRVPVGICIIADGEVVFANPEQEKFLSVHPASAGSVLSLNVHPEDAAAFESICRAGTQGGSPVTEADIRVLPGGAADPEEVRWVRCKTGSIRYQGRDSVLLSMMDITRTKELEQVVAAQEKLALLGQLSSGIAHEIRNPLSGINIFLSMLELQFREFQGSDPEDRRAIRKTIEQIRDASTMIASVIQRVMDFTRQAPPRVAPVNMNRVVDDAVQVSRGVLQKCGIDMSLKPDKNLPECRADPRLLGQVLINLISNAVQAMELRRGPKLLEIATSAENGRVVLRVSDSGPGVPVKIRRRIFEPFFTTRKEGYGIGLSFSHRVVAEHSGSLTVGTSRWGGAEFRIELPIEGKSNPG